MSNKINDNKQLLVALDIGTTKVVAMIAELSDTGEIEVIGVGHSESKGLKKGVIVNIDLTVKAISDAVLDAELMSGCKVNSVYVGISGGHINSINSHGIVAIKNNEVSLSDVERVIDAAKAISLSADQKIIHILPQEFMIDDQKDIKEPIGMSGVRLESRVHIVTGSVSATQNIIKGIRRAGFDVEHIVLQQLASSHAVLSEDEKELGVCLVDIGGGTTDIAIFTKGSIRYTSVIPIGGNHVTNDIAVALRTPPRASEKIKLKYGHIGDDNKTEEDDFIDIPRIDEQQYIPVKRKKLVNVMECRYEELLQLVYNEVLRLGFIDLIPAGIVLTGGSAKVPGIVDVAEKIFDLPVRIGYPGNVSGMEDIIKNPSYATAIGILHYASHHESVKKSGHKFNSYKINNTWNKVKSWVRNNIVKEIMDFKSS